MGRDADKLRYLEGLYDWQEAGKEGIPRLRELFGDDLRGSDNYWRGIIDALVSAGLLNDASGGGGLEGISAWLTSAGDECVEDVRERRRNPTARRKAAPTLLLRWIDTQDHGSASWQSVFPAFDTIKFLGGAPLTQMEILGAARRLADDGLIEAREGIAELNGPDQVRILPDGQRCVESDLEIDEWIARNRRPQPTVQYNLSGNFHNNNIAAGGSDFTQTLSSSGAPSDDISVLMDAVLEAIERLGLSSDQADEVRRNADQVKGEVARAEPDEGVVKVLLDRVADGVKEGTAKATRATLLFLIDYWLIRMGLPPAS